MTLFILEWHNLRNRTRYKLGQNWDFLIVISLTLKKVPSGHGIFILWFIVVSDGKPPEMENWSKMAKNGRKVYCWRGQIQTPYWISNELIKWAANEMNFENFLEKIGYWIFISLRFLKIFISKITQTLA